MRLFQVFLLLLCLAAKPVFCQYTAARVVFLNSGPYPEADLLKLEQLKPGDSFTQSDLQADAARLADSGYFDDVQASLDGPFKSIEVRFKLAPVNPSKLFLPTYKNLVWLSSSDLADFQQSVPLLSFGIPESGSTQAAVQTALEQLLTSRSINAKLSYTVVEPSTGHPRGSVVYQVDSPQVRIQKVDLAGVDPFMTPSVKAKLQHVLNSLYNEAQAGNSTADQLLALWQNDGYIDAHFEHFERSIDPASTSQRILVDVQATVVAGEAYKVSAVNFTTTPIESVQQFTTTQRLHPGDLASSSALLATLAPVTGAYHSLGYQDAVVDAIPTRNPAIHQVAYTVSVVPGAQYRIRTITINGLPSAVRADFDSTFLLHTGDLYNETYVRSFFNQNKSIHSLDGYSADFTATADPATDLLDLTINFVSGEASTMK